MSVSVCGDTPSWLLEIDSRWGVVNSMGGANGCGEFNGVWIQME